MADRYRGTLYTGVTSNIALRTTQHREGRGSEFVKRYNLHQLVYMEWHDDIEDAIRREKAIKKWNRAWKIRQIESMNADWDDLFEVLNA